MIVLDASAAVEWLLGRRAAPAVAARFADPAETIHAPALLGVEVASALRGLVLGGHASSQRGQAALSDLVAADIALHDPTPLLERAWALQSNLSVYDAVYVALAETLDATLVTADAHLARATGHTATLEVVST